MAAEAPTAGELCERCGDLLPEAEAVWVEDARYCRRCYALGGGERRDLRLESEIRFLGIAIICGATFFIGLLLIFTLLTVVVMTSEGIGTPIDYVIAALVALVLLAAGLFCVIVAIHLRALRRWARIAAGILCIVQAGFWVWVAAQGGHALLVLPGIFLGLVLGVLLFSPRMARLTTPTYRALAALDPRRPRPVSWLGLVLTTGVVLLTLLLVVSLW